MLCSVRYELLRLSNSGCSARKTATGCPDGAGGPMSRPKSPPRVTGPYSERNGTRFRIRIIRGELERNVYFRTFEEAMAGKIDAEARIDDEPLDYRVCTIIDRFLVDQLRYGRCKPTTAEYERDRLYFAFQDCLNASIKTMTPRFAEQMYEQLVNRPSKKSGRPLSASTHHFYLHLAKKLFAWAEAKRYVIESPFKHVRPQGRKNAGKPQLRVDEANRFINVAFKLYDECDDVLALAAVVALLMGLRASEVLNRSARDVDCGGSLLWVEAGKTANARRQLRIPKVLQSRMIKLSAGKEPDAPLLGLNRKGEPRHPRVLWQAVGRICQQAGVPRVCTHSLRGLWATLGVESGAVTELVAASLGHGSFEMTARHYARPEAVSAARTARVLELLNLDGADAAASEELTDAEAEKVLAQLPSATLARLVLRMQRGPRPQQS